MAELLTSTDGDLLWATILPYARFVVVAYWLLSASLVIVLYVLDFSWLFVFSCFGSAANT